MQGKTEQQTQTKDISKVGEIDHFKTKDILEKVKEIIKKGGRK